MKSYLPSQRLIQRIASAISESTGNSVAKILDNDNTQSGETTLDRMALTVTLFDLFEGSAVKDLMRAIFGMDARLPNYYYYTDQHKKFMLAYRSDDKDIVFYQGLIKKLRRLFPSLEEALAPLKDDTLQTPFIASRDHEIHCTYHLVIGYAAMLMNVPLQCIFKEPVLHMIPRVASFNRLRCLFSDKKQTDLAGVIGTCQASITGFGKKQEQYFLLSHRKAFESVRYREVLHELELAFPLFAQ